jgi:hypothetical protein
MELFVVMDKAMLGRGVFGVFSHIDTAESFVADLKFHSIVMVFSLIGPYDGSGKVYAAHSYDHFYDTHVFDGIYSESELAYEAVGQKGLILEFVLDMPAEKRIIVDGDPAQH